MMKRIVVFLIFIFLIGIDYLPHISSDEQPRGTTLYLDGVE